MKKKMIHKLLFGFIFISQCGYAGDPGPFEIDFYDAGVPVWLDRDQVLSSLKSQKVWLGVTSRHNEKGRYVSRVFKNSPADKADIRVGDIIEYESWNALFEGTNPNEVLNLTILREKKKVSKKINLGARDPLVDMLISIAGDGHHSSVKHREIHTLSMKNKKSVYKNIFLKNKAFDCKNAHKKSSIKMLPESDFRGGGQVVVIRGSRRAMFINMGMRHENIGKKTICIKSADYDGQHLTKEKVTKLYWKLFGDQVEYWYAHP